MAKLNELCDDRAKLEAHYKNLSEAIKRVEDKLTAINFEIYNLESK